MLNKQLILTAANAELKHLFTPHHNEIYAEAVNDGWYVICWYEGPEGGIDAFKPLSGQKIAANNRSTIGYEEYMYIASFDDDKIQCNEEYEEAAEIFMRRVRELDNIEG